MSEFDESWKGVLREYFPEFVQFFFPQAHEKIDWSRGVEFLDKELQQLTPDGDAGTRVVDQLVKVFRHEGGETWVLIHVEVQSQRIPDLPQRMYVYQYRLSDRFQRPIASWCVLGDDEPGYRPSLYEVSTFGCTVSMRFPVAKILDFAGQEVELEANPNLFALAVLTHLKALQTRRNQTERQNWKLRLLRDLSALGLERERIRALYLFMHWVMDLPEAAEEQLRQILAESTEGLVVSLLPPWEVRAEVRGLRTGLMRALRGMLSTRFNEEGLALLPKFEAVTDVNVIDAAVTRLENGGTLDEVRALLPD